MSEENDDEKVHEGQVAIIHYVGRIAEGPEEGEVFDTTNVDVALEEGIYHDHRDYKPLEFRIGEDKVLEGLDEAVVGMRRGEEKTVVVEPERAFGERDTDEVVEFPREMFEEADAEVEEGKLAKTQDGRSGWVTEIDDETVTIDFNHELAGTRVEFEIKLLDVHGAPGDESARTWEKKKGKTAKVRKKEENGNEEG
ncbi:MAG: FKBP-type peptidyl-prolyl cis-trans isomerase [Halobacteriales archaeon]|nr:FKBP-type peptidyl-prolyl cis-trans isomerase [Halobacteriales archaeon]